MMTRLLRRPNGTQILREIQAVALLEASEVGGLFGHIRVGAGKTHISYLLPTVLHARRPLLLVPAALIEKTKSDFSEIAQHWVNTAPIQIYSYSKLGLENYKGLLEAFQPDLIIADEAHKLRHLRKSAVARRVARYFADHPRTQFACLSGTLTEGSVKDYAHLLQWSLKGHAPIPLDDESVSAWADILDANAEEGADQAAIVPSLGAWNSLSEARQAFQGRLASAPGVIISSDSWNDQPLTIRTIQLPVPKGCLEHLDTLRTLWRAPDGWDLADARFEVWAVARQLGRGFCLVRDPRPPEDWFLARRAWCGFCRKLIEYSNFDSEFEIAKACSQGHLPSDEYWRWQQIKDTYKPNSVPLWFDDSIVRWCAAWGRETPGLIWVEHVAFGEALSKLTGWRYYREKGLDARGADIRNADPTQTAIVSVDSIKEGQNLQAFNRNLFVATSNSATETEQIIGRTHRDGQTKPVHVDMLQIVDEDFNCLANAIRKAEYIRESTSQEQKLLIARYM